MKAFFIEEIGKTCVKETAVPTPREDEVLIKVMAVGVSGAGAHVYLGACEKCAPRVVGLVFLGVAEAGGGGG